MLKQILTTSSQPVTRGTEQALPALNDTVARLVLAQMRPQLVEPDNAESRRFELMLRSESSIDGIQISIETTPLRTEAKEQEQFEEGHAEQEKKWTVRLAFDFPELGPVTAFIMLMGNTRVELQFWATRPATKRLIEDRQRRLTQRLSEQLDEQGINDLTFSVFEGEPAPRPNVTTELLHEIV